ncbi:transcriptional regulator [Bifidobacterium margollesii]|uniref:Transcriptional regulator n=1 Tax=Bifidobacterium margollesii TaxID=2020964 RepID=A0A2N5J9M7_9BIFI|nr:transcriptional regulator [Bifidobacterium margollesii]
MMKTSETASATAVCTRSGGWWAVEVPEIPGLFTQARHLDQVEDMVRDAAGMLDVQVGAVTVKPRLDESSRLVATPSPHCEGKD